MQRRMSFVGAAIARDQVQCRYGHIQFRFVGVFDRQEFRNGAVDLERAQPEIPPDAVLDVHHRGAGV